MVSEISRISDHNANFISLHSRKTAIHPFTVRTFKQHQYSAHNTFLFSKVHKIGDVKFVMASGFNFDNSVFKWNSADIYHVFERFKQRVSFVVEVHYKNRKKQIKQDG